MDFTNLIIFFEVKRKMSEEIFNGFTGLFQSEAKDEICGSRGFMKNCLFKMKRKLNPREGGIADV